MSIHSSHGVQPRRLFQLGLVFAAASLMSTQAPTQALAGKDLSWVGCGISKKAFMTALATAYEAKTGTHIDLQGGGATRGIRDVAAGRAEMGGSCRHRVMALSERGAKLNHVAWDAVVVITHPSNPVTNLSKKALADIFSGRIKNWKALGGPDMAIKVVARKGKVSGVGMMVRELLFQDANYDFTNNVITLRSSGPVEKMVEKDPAAIAFTGVSSAKKRQVKMVSVDGKVPTAANIADGSYFLYRPLYLVTSTHPSKEVQGFLDFALSTEGQSIIAGEGTVTLAQGKNLWALYKRSMRAAKVASGSY